MAGVSRGYRTDGHETSASTRDSDWTKATGAEEMKSRRTSYEARPTPPSLRRVLIFRAGV